jgi:two-component system chemotaxis sensor kinase CheA
MPLNQPAKRPSPSSRFAPHSDLFRKANEPLLLIRELRTLGEATVTLDASRLPPLDQLDPEAAYFAWDITLDGPATRAQIEEVFEFVTDDCDLSIDREEEQGALTVRLEEPPPVLRQPTPWSARSSSPNPC